MGTMAKKLSFFSNVGYLEALPTLKGGRDQQTYAQILNDFKRKRLNKQRSKNESVLLNEFISHLHMHRIDEKIKKILTAQYIVDTLIQYQTMRLISNQSVKQRILIFAKTANDASKIAKLCNLNGLTAAAIHYKKSEHECRQILDNYKEGKLCVLVNVDMVNEGFDLPSIDCVVMARLTCSEIIFVQQLGRGLRRGQNTEVCILDLAINLRRRWKFLQNIISDQQIISYIDNFWNVENFVGQMQ